MERTLIAKIQRSRRKPIYKVKAYRKAIKVKSPKHLSHKPIISVNHYDKLDALYVNNTDVKALSIGEAQYDNNHISLKVWRKPNNRWSRQSEELPIHRNLDLSILFVTALSTDIVNPQSIVSKPNENLTVDEPEKVQKIKDYYTKNKQFLEPRLKELKRLLNEIL